MTENCALCGNTINPERKPVQLDGDGLPLAIATIKGLGVPFTEQSPLLRVLVNGEEAAGCVGFDRDRSLAWVYQKNGTGSYVIRDDAIAVEQVEGVITVERLGEAA